MTKSLLFTFALALLAGCGAGDESDDASTADGLKYIGAVLTVTTTGPGRVTSAPAGIDCASTCRAAFEWSSAVELTATPAPGASFAGWSGVCSGTTTKCIVTMSGARSVSAVFSASAPPPPGSFGPNTPEGQGYADGAAATANSAAFQRAIDHATRRANA